MKKIILILLLSVSIAYGQSNYVQKTIALYSVSEYPLAYTYAPVYQNTIPEISDTVYACDSVWFLLWSPDVTQGSCCGEYPIYIDNTFIENYPTAIKVPLNSDKSGVITIYDSQGRFIKSSPVSDYTNGLLPGTLYIYNAVYSDNTVGAGKFIIE